MKPNVLIESSSKRSAVADIPPTYPLSTQDIFCTPGRVVPGGTGMYTGESNNAASAFCSGEVNK